MRAGFLVHTLWVVAAGCTSPGGGSGGPGPELRDTAPSDTAPLLDTRPLADTTPDTRVAPTCQVGVPCNDADPCTINDACVDGRCVGEPLDCSDALPCTVDACSGGACSHEVTVGSCLVDDACWTDLQANPANQCLRCEAAVNQLGWTSPDGLKCDDGDPCTDGETCMARVCSGGVAPVEICDDTVDNDCDGKTDAEDSACGGTVTCTFHNDCYPERVCAEWATTGTQLCSDPCAGDADCDAGEICSKVPGSTQVGFCQAPPAGLKGRLNACDKGAECTSGICVDGLCADLCLNEAACSDPGFTCRIAGDPAAGLVTAACLPDSGTISNGQICTDDGGSSYFSGLCASGHCDVMPWPSAVLPCAPICKGQADCPTTQQCDILLYATTEDPDAIPYHPQFSQRTYSAIAGCYTPPQAAGAGQLGTPCTHPSDCRSYKCLPLIPADPTRYCTTYCEHDVECPTGMQCKLEVTNLASTWLQAEHVGSQAVAPGAWTLVRTCKFE